MVGSPAVVDPPAGLPADHALSEKVPYAARAVCEEMTSCLVSAALVTSALNLVIAEKHIKSIDHVFRCLPAEPAVPAALGRGLIAVDFDGATVGTLNAFLECIGVGRAAIARCELFDGRCDDLAAKKLEDLCLQWRQICALGIAVLCCLERSCSAFWSTERLRTFDRLIELLSNARDGERPYLGADGYPIIPHWAEQRGHRRQRVDFCARIRADGETHSAIIADISSDGIGLDRIFGLRAGCRVGVQLDDGREFEGIVTWTAGGRAGLQIC